MMKRLRRRFIRIAVCSVAAVLALLLGILNLANYLSTDARQTDMLQMIQRNQGRIPPSHQSPPGGGEPGRHSDPETPYSTRYFVLFYEDDGTLIRADLDRIAAVSSEDLGPYLSYAAQSGEGFGRMGSYRTLTARSDSGERMTIFLDNRKEAESVGRTALLSLAAGLFCVALVTVLVVLLSRRAIDPLVRQNERQKQFITDASHELKTPITVIATSLRLAEMENGKQKWIDKALAQTEKLTGLVNSLVTLSRFDEEEPALRFSSFPVSEALTETALSFSEAAEAHGTPLSLAIEPGLSFTGDEYAVRQLASILLDNAIKYARPGSPILFSLKKAKKGVEIDCENACSPIPSQELPRLFDRFYRADKARTAGGYGVGLSIARSIAEAHRGSVRAVCPQEDRILFQAILCG